MDSMGMVMDRVLFREDDDDFREDDDVEEEVLSPDSEVL